MRTVITALTFLGFKITSPALSAKKEQVHSGILLAFVLFAGTNLLQCLFWIKNIEFASQNTLLLVDLGCIIYIPVILALGTLMKNKVLIVHPFINSLIKILALKFLLNAFFYTFSEFVIPPFISESFNNGFILFNLVIIGIAIGNIKKESVEGKFTQESEKETKNEKPAAKKEFCLSIEEADQYHTNLKALIEKDKVHLDGELNEKKLADHLNLPSHLLSKLLNQYVGQSFHDFINSYRIQEAKRILQNPENKNFTNFAVALDCGYNSESVFYANFKKYTGTTPAKFKKMHLN